MKPYFKGVKLAFCIYQLFYGLAAINRGEQVSPVVFTLVVAILFLDVVIDKKWRKRYGYKRVPKNELYILKNEGKVYGHSKYIDAIIRECKKNNGVARDVCFR